MPHDIEEAGIKLLLEHLQSSGHQVKRIHGTFDIEVDGRCAEVKAKSKCFEKMDFISLTDKQYRAAVTHDFDLYIVCGVNGGAPEFYKVQAHALMSKKPRIVISYEYDKNALRGALERL